MSIWKPTKAKAIARTTKFSDKNLTPATMKMIKMEMNGI